MAMLIALVLTCGVSAHVRAFRSPSAAANASESAHLESASTRAALLALSFSSTVGLSSSLPAPTGLKAKAGNTQVSLTWNGVKGASGYWIDDRNVTAGQPNYTRLPFPVSSTSFTVKSLTNGDKYCFFVTAFNANGGSGPSNIACATPS